MHISTIAENLVNIDREISKIFGGICQFLPCHPKTDTGYPCNLWGYWTDLHQICTLHRNVAKILPMNIGMAILQFIFEHHYAK